MLLNTSVSMAATVLLLLATGGSDAEEWIGSRQDIDLKNQGCKLCTESPTGYFEAESLKRYDGQINFNEYMNYAMRSLSLVVGFDNDLHRYDHKQDLIHSFSRNLTYSDDLTNLKARIDTSESELLGDQSELTLIENELNQNECAKHLEVLTEESRKLFTDFNSFSTSKQLGLIDFLDSWGSSPSSQLMMGNYMWLGNERQCTGSRPGGTKTRYCVANYLSPDHISGPTDKLTHQPRTGSEALKIGICLPHSCNSISTRRHSRSLDALVKLVRLNQVPFSSYKLSNLFCLPDESSPLRQFSLSAKIFIVCLSSWLTTVLYFSLKYEYLRLKNPTAFDASTGKLMRVFAFRLNWASLFDSPDRSTAPVSVVKAKLAESTDGESGIESSDSESCGQEETPNDIKSTDSTDQGSIPRSISLDGDGDVNTNRSMRTSNMMQSLGESALSGKCLSRNNKKHPQERRRSTISMLEAPSQRAGADGSGDISKASAIPAANLAAIDGIKVLSMIWLISAHTLLFFIRSISNSKDFWSILRDARFMTVLAGIFPVDSFFVVTGVLTAFLKFTKDDGAAMTKVHYWVETFVHRYLRFMPMYLIIFWYTRDVSQYIGSGPLWDYATADTSLRSVCKQESMAVPVFFQANFKPIDQHCVKPAWYLANDYQYLLITPIFIGLIMKSKFLGYTAICLSILMSLVMQFITVFYAKDFTDFEALVNFRPMFSTYVLKNLWRLYVLPFNRIPPYLVGLITGHLMYSLSKLAKSQSTESIASSTSSGNPHNNDENILKSPSRIDFRSYICTKVWTPLLVLISIIYLPLTTKLSTLTGLQAEIGASCIIALMRFSWSIAIARLIYISSGSTNSFVIRFLSSPKWKPWSKIGLSVLLIQWEIVSYLSQTQPNLPYMTISFLMAVVLVCIVATYTLSLLIYLTIEYPLSQIEHLYLHPVLFKRR